MTRFRKVFTKGPLRTTLTGRGVGWSFGIPGLRIGCSSRGGINLSTGIPGTGLYYTKRLTADVNSED
jgi:hypothetical protein